METLLTYEKFERLKFLEHRRKELLGFLDFQGAKHISIFYFSTKIVGNVHYNLFDEPSVIQAAKEEARRLVELTQSEIDALLRQNQQESKEENVPGSFPGLIHRLFKRNN